MKSSIGQSVVLVFAVVAAAVCGAQSSSSGSASEDLHGLQVKQLPMRPMPTPFPLDVRTGRVQTLEFRAPEAMTAADRELADSAQVEIARRAGLQGFMAGVGRAGLNEEETAGPASWGYEQAVCPAFPEHLILEYSRFNGTGDVSLFSAVVPRGEGHVRVIPVRRRSYSLWTPASSNALTLNDFNHMVKEGGTGVSPDWLTLSLCYTALAGGHVSAALQAMRPTEESFSMFAPVKLSVSRKGGAAVFLVNTTPPATKAEWVLTFAQSGRLLKVHRTGPNELVERPVPGNATDDVKGVPMKESAVDVGKPGQ
jgi:hypothetical protein